MILSVSVGLLINLLILSLVVFLSAFGTPGATIGLISSGALANNYFELGLMMFVGVLAASLGDILAYFLANKFSMRLFAVLRRFRFFKDNESNVKNKFKKSEFSLVFLTRFLFTGLGAAVSYISGFVHMDKKKYFSAVFFGELLFGVSYPLIGFIFRETWNEIATIITNVVTILILALLVFFLFRIVRQKRQNKLQLMR